MKAIIIAALSLAACAVQQTATSHQALCTEEDVNNGTCQPSYSWAQIQSYAYQQPASYAASNYPGATLNSASCHSGDGVVICSAAATVPFTNITVAIVCDVTYTVSYPPGGPVYTVTSVNCRVG